MESRAILGRAQFGNVCYALDDLKLSDIEYRHIFEVLKIYVEKNKKWIQGQKNFEVQNRIRMSFALFCE